MRRETLHFWTIVMAEGWLSQTEEGQHALSSQQLRRLRSNFKQSFQRQRKTEKGIKQHSKGRSPHPEVLTGARLPLALTLWFASTKLRLHGFRTDSQLGGSFTWSFKAMISFGQIL